MKRIRHSSLLLIATLQIAVAATTTHAQTDQEVLNGLNTMVSSALLAGNYESGEKLATESIALSSKLFGAESSETAAAYLNRAYAKKRKERYRDAIEDYRAAINILERLPSPEPKVLVGAHQSLAHAFYMKGDLQDAIAEFESTIQTSDRLSGPRSKDSFESTFNIAIIYRSRKNYSEAHKYIVKSLWLALKHFGEYSQEVKSVDDMRICIRADHEFSKQENQDYEETLDEFITFQGTKANYQDNEILVGKAISLPKPEYPSSISKQGIKGKVVVKLVIGKDGKVLTASAACGHEVLRFFAESAARRARFNPTLVDGKPAIAWGFVIYKFNK